MGLFKYLVESSDLNLTIHDIIFTISKTQLQWSNLIVASSAGNKPANNVNPIVVEVMKEKGIDISIYKPRLITFQMGQEADLFVTLGCNAEGICPGPFFKPAVDWKLENPKDKSIEKVREIRELTQNIHQHLPSQAKQTLERTTGKLVHVWQYVKSVSVTTSLIQSFPQKK